MLTILFALLLYAHPVQAHPLDTAFFDFEQAASGTTFTVAMQPPEAFEVVRKPEDQEWNLERFRERGEMLAAFVANHVSFSRGGAPCEWDAAMGPVADSMFDALADGVTVTGVVACAVNDGPLTLTSDLFMDRFPGQRNTVRRANDDAYTEMLVMTSSSQTVVLSLDSLHPSPSSNAASNAETSFTINARNPAGVLAFLAIIIVYTIYRQRRRSERPSTE